MKLQRLSFLLSVTVSNALAACQLTSEPTTTVVTGTITNKYTNQPVAGVPVSVTHVAQMYWGGSYIDSITSAISDANGKYILTVDYPANKDYLVNTVYSKDFYDLTYFSNDNFDNGAKIQHSKTNQVDIYVTDYKTVTVNINSSKGGKTDIALSFVNKDGNYFGGGFFYDTVKAHQQFNFVQKIKVIPNRTYSFDKLLANRVIQGYNVTFKDYSTETHIRKVLYDDTTKIFFH